MLPSTLRALVTGGAGFIGSHVVERLIDLGAQVTVIDDVSTGRLENLRGVVSKIDLDRRPVLELLEEPDPFQCFDVIFHLAANAYIPPSIEDPSYDYYLNLHTTFRLLEALRRSDHRPLLVNASTAAVYGNPARLPIHESDPTVPISPYGVSKLAGERYTAVFSELYDIPTLSVRFFSVYGPRQHKQVVYDLIDRVTRNPERLEVLGDGTQERDFAFVEDVAGAIIHLADKAPGRGEVFNVASGTSHTIADLVFAVCEALGVQPEIAYTGAVRPGDAERWAVDTSALGALGFRPVTNLVQGVRATWDWYRAQRS